MKVRAPTSCARLGRNEAVVRKSYPPSGARRRTTGTLDAVEALRGSCYELGSSHESKFAEPRVAETAISSGNPRLPWRVTLLQLVNERTGELGRC